MRTKGRFARLILVAAVSCDVVFLTGCGQESKAAAPAAVVVPPGANSQSSVAQATAPRALRTQGLISAQRALSVQVPRLTGQGGQITLTKLTPNGTLVKPGDVVAEFDNTPQLKAQRDAQAKYDDLAHQVDQKMAEQRSNAAKRSSDLVQAQADWDKARLELRKGPVLSDLEQAKNKEKVAAAQAHVESLLRSNQFHDEAEKTEVEILIRQRDRQKFTVARLQNDLDKLTVRSSIEGMVALENTWKNNSMGHPQEGDQLYAGSPLLRIFDPSSMVLQLSVNEADGAALQPGSTAVVRLDAYPGLKFNARFESASPVAASALGSPLKMFSALYALDSKDPHLLPDLTASADIMPPEAAAK